MAWAVSAKAWLGMVIGAIFGSRSRLLSHDSENRECGVLKRELIDNRWYGKKAFSGLSALNFRMRRFGDSLD